MNASGEKMKLDRPLVLATKNRGKVPEFKDLFRGFDPVTDMCLDQQYIALRGEIEWPPPGPVFGLYAIGFLPGAPVTGLQGHFLFRHLK